MNKFDLFDALGGVDEDLLERSERKAPKRLSLRKAFIAAAAVMMMVVTVFATPKLMKLFFGGELTQIGKGIHYVTESGLVLIQDAVYEVDMTYPCAETAPETIEEYRLPTFFEEYGWNCDFNHVDLSAPDTNALYLFFAPDTPEYQVLFYQSPFSTSETRGSGQFLMNTGRTGLVTEQEVTIGEFSGTMYVIEPSEADDEPGMKNLVWSDGEYAYLMECGYTMPDEMIAEIVLSLAPVEDISLYGEYYDHEIDDEHRIPIEIFYTLSDLPDGYELEERTWDMNNTDQEWSKGDLETISFFQSRLLTDENHGPSIDIEYTLIDVMASLDPYEYDTAEENGLLYHIVRHQGDTYAMWEDSEYVFLLRFNYQTITTEEMLGHLRNIVPMDDFTDHLTD